MLGQPNNENQSLLSATAYKKDEQLHFYNILGDYRSEADVLQVAFEEVLYSIYNKSINEDLLKSSNEEKEKLHNFEARKTEFIQAGKDAFNELVSSHIICTPDFMSKKITIENCTQSALIIEQMQALLKTAQCMRTYIYSTPDMQVKSLNELKVQIKDYEGMEKKQDRSLSNKVGKALGVFLACTIGLTVAFIALIAVAAAATAIVATGDLRLRL